jgi:hypothetical protein
LKHRPTSLFRGSELPRLLFLVAIALAGWPAVVLFSRPQAADTPPPPSVPVERITKIVPDEGIEFQALIDKEAVLPRESAAYATLLQRTRETPAKELASQARRDVFWAQLWERPQAFRGVPIHLEGTVKKVLADEVGPAMSPKGRLFSVWFYSDENHSFPYVVVVEDPPPGLVVGYELHLRATFDAYFMKLLRYQAGDTTRAAPMLVGRMQLTAAQAEAPPPMVEIRDFARKHAITILVVILLGYLSLRVLFQVRRILAPTPLASTYRTTSDGLPPEEVADWLRNLPEHVAETEAEEDVPPLRDEPHLNDR